MEVRWVKFEAGIRIIRVELIQYIKLDDWKNNIHERISCLLININFLFN